MGDGLEQGRTEIARCYHRGLREGGGQWFEDGTRPKTTLLLLTITITVICSAKADVACN